MTLRQAIGQARLSYRPLAAKIKISATALSRLLNTGEYPARIGEAETKRRLIEFFKTKTNIDPALIEWPGKPRAVVAAPKKKRVLVLNTTEEIDLMQLDRNVLSLFGLRTNPFQNDVEADSDVFRFKGYDLVDESVRDAIEQRGFIAIVAESGSGKTTIWDGIESEYGTREDTVICRPQVKAKEKLTPEHLARCLIYGLLGEDIAIKGNAEDRGRQLSTALRAIRSGASDRRVVLFIDDAHFCGASVLRQLKTFFEEKIGRYRLLAIVMIGLPSLKTKLSQFPEVGNRIRLVEVPPVPVKEYLDFKLRRVGSSVDRLFDAGGLDAFLERFKEPRRGALGRPLVINASCIRAMVALARNGGQAGERITRDIVDQLPGESLARRVS